MTRIVDLSAPIAPTPPDAPRFQRNDVQYFDHAAGAAEVEEMFGVPSRLLRDGEAWAREEVTLGTHNSTHVDAPYHYNSRIQSAPAATIDELPLEWFFGPGVVLDMTAKQDGEQVDVADVEAELDRIGHVLGERDIVLVRTARDARLDDASYVAIGPSMTQAATRWLYDHGVRVMGIDAWGWDGPLHRQAHDALERDEPGIFWAAHQADLPYAQIERLANLAELPPSGFQVA
jgi:kynurenine formamidase